MSYITGENVSILLFFVGVYGLIARRNIIKSIIAFSIMQSAVILYFLSAGMVPGSIPPIGVLPVGATMVDPLPQALMITDIVIGVGVTATTLTMFINHYHRYGTTNWQKAREKRMK